MSVSEKSISHMQIRSFSLNFFANFPPPRSRIRMQMSAKLHLHVHNFIFYQIEIGRIVATGADQNVPTNGRRSVCLLAAVHQMAWQAVLQE